MSQVKKAKKRKVNVESEGIAYILASFNNVIVTITNKQGQVVAWSSSGREGFRGSKKNTQG
jgi:small subunit ribosomal protein S11